MNAVNQPMLANQPMIANQPAPNAAYIPNPPYINAESSPNNDLEQAYVPLNNGEDQNPLNPNQRPS